MTENPGTGGPTQVFGTTPTTDPEDEQVRALRKRVAAQDAELAALKEKEDAANQPQQPARTVGKYHDLTEAEIKALNLRRRDNPTLPVMHGGLLPSGLAGGKVRRKSLWLDSPDQLKDRDRKEHDKYWRQREVEAIERVEAGERQRLINRLRLNVNNGATGAVFVVNGKSAGKTRFLQTVAACVKHYTGRSVAQMPGTANIATCTLNRMSDIPPSARMDIYTFYKEVMGVRYPREIMGLVPLTDTDHVGVIGERQATADLKPTYGTIPFVQVAIRLLLTNDLLLMDGGNDDIDDGSIPSWAARLAHCLVHLYRPNDAPVIGTMRSDVFAFRADRRSGEKYLEGWATLAESHNDPLIDAYTLGLTGMGIATPVKVANSVVVAAQAPGVDLTQVEQYMQIPQGHGRSPLSEWKGRAVSFRTDPWFQGTRPGPDGVPEPNACIWERLAPDTQMDALHAAVAITEQIGVNRNLELGDEFKNKPPIEIDER
jgi:hypothetical protein